MQTTFFQSFLRQFTHTHAQTQNKSLEVSDITNVPVLVPALLCTQVREHLAPR